MGAMGLDSTLNIAHRACAKYSKLNKITHVNCAKTGDMEIAHVNVLEIAHHFSLCRHNLTGKNGDMFLCATFNTTHLSVLFLYAI